MHALSSHVVAISHGQLGNSKFPAKVCRDITKKMQHGLICSCFANGDKMEVSFYWCVPESQCTIVSLQRRSRLI